MLVELGIAQASARGRREGRALRRIDPLLDAMGFDPVSIDQIVAAHGRQRSLPSAPGSRACEIEGRVAAMAGGRFQQRRIE